MLYPCLTIVYTLVECLCNVKLSETLTSFTSITSLSLLLQRLWHGFRSSQRATRFLNHSFCEFLGGAWLKEVMVQNRNENVWLPFQLFDWKEFHSDFDFGMKWKWLDLYRTQSLLSFIDSNSHSNFDFNFDHESNTSEDLAILIPNYSNFHFDFDYKSNIFLFYY